MRAGGWRRDTVSQCTADERFWSKVVKGRDWRLWTASRTSHGRGQFRVGGKMRQAPRVACVLTDGTGPPKILRSSFGNRGCIRPDHHVAAEVRTAPCQVEVSGRGAR